MVNIPSDIPSLLSLTKALHLESEYPDLLRDSWSAIKENSSQILTSSASLWYQEDPWDSAWFKKKVVKVQHVYGNDRTAIQRCVHTLQKKYPSSYILFRINQLHTDWIQEIEKKGAIILDCSIDLVCTDLSSLKTSDGSYSCVRATTSDESKILECAKSFKYGRFFSDPSFTDGTSIYKEWIINTLKKDSGNDVFILKHQESFCGFVSIMIRKIGTYSLLYVSLIAKHPSCKIPDIASTLLNEVKKIAHQKNCIAVTLGTQTNNIPALRAYIKNSFSPYSSEFTARLIT